MASTPNFGRTALILLIAGLPNWVSMQACSATTTTTQTPPQNPPKYRLQAEDTPLKPSEIQTYV